MLNHIINSPTFIYYLLFIIYYIADILKINNNFTKIVFSNKFKFTKINIIYFKKY